MTATLSPENLEKLFLFEIYVETLKIDYPKLCLTQSSLDSMKETIIKLQFLGFKPVEIKEEQFAKIQPECSPPIGLECGEQKVMAGQSCLFSLRDLPNEIKCLEVGLSVIRPTEAGQDFPLGVASIKLGEDFANILKALEPKKFSASMKNSFTLFDKKCVVTGKITLSITLSCFGNMITTSFQLGGEDSKAYVVQPGGEVPMSEFLSRSTLGKGSCPSENTFGRLLGGGIQGGGTCPYGGGSQDRRGYEGGLLGGVSYVGGIQVGPYGDDQGMITKQTPYATSTADSSSSCEELPAPVTMPQLTFCSCDYPIPPQFVAKPPPRPKKKKKKKQGCPLGYMKDYCLNPGCPMGYPDLPVFEEQHTVCQAMEIPPGFIGLKGEQMILQLPSDNTPMPGNRKARFSFGGAIDKNLNDLRIMKDVEAKTHTMPSFCRDVFIMKIGKTNQETEQRHSMVLEIKQPKVPKLEEELLAHATQYFEGDIRHVVKKTDGKKKEKGKGKKEKKGKGKKEKKGKGKKEKKGKGKKEKKGKGKKEEKGKKK